MTNHVIIKFKKLAKRQVNDFSPEVALARLAREAGAPFSDHPLPVADPDYEWMIEELPNKDIKVSWRLADDGTHPDHPEG